jgi:hypothetical protein
MNKPSLAAKLFAAEMLICYKRWAATDETMSEYVPSKETMENSRSHATIDEKNR